MSLSLSLSCSFGENDVVMTQKRASICLPTLPGVRVIHSPCPVIICDNDGASLFHIALQREVPACQQSCLFLKTISMVHAGECPAESAAEDFAAACVNGCQQDKDCERGLKCCSNGCGQTCQQPINQYQGDEYSCHKESCTPMK